MADQVTNYKCPACGGPMHFSGAAGKLVCDYCDSTFTVAEVEAMMEAESEKAVEAKAAADAAEEEARASSEWEYTSDAWNEDGMKVYNCPSCGAELVCDENTAATSCPYCGNPTIVPGQFSGMLKPEYVVPFKLEKKDAIAALTAHYKGKVLLPKSFTEGNHIEEVKGVYVPFWLFDGIASGDADYEGQKDTVRRVRDEKITKTDHFNVHRDGQVRFEKIPADASSHMPDAMMDSIEPYDYSAIQPFSKAYLAGFLADKYDVTAEEATPRMEERAANSLQNLLKESAEGYDRIITKRSHSVIKDGKASYAMMPVWMLSTRWNDQNYLFAMNGQTGKMVGDLPMDKGKYWKIFFLVILITEIVMAFINGGMGDAELVSMFLSFVALPIGLALIIGSVLKGQLRSIYKATEAGKYIKRDTFKLRVKTDNFSHTTEKREKINN